MYIPRHFRIEDADKLKAFMRQYSFATVVTHDGTAPFASHLPVLFHEGPTPHGSLVTHMARANPQWRHFATGAEVLVIFHGPHTYISPSWYESKVEVPTWNYAAVHAYGVPTVIDNPERVLALLDETIATYEAGFEKPWPGELPQEFLNRLMQGIVAFEIPIARVEGKFKLSQNRTPADVQGVIAALSQSAHPEDRAVGELMKSESAGKGA